MVLVTVIFYLNTSPQIFPTANKIICFHLQCSYIVVVQPFTCVQHFATSWTTQLVRIPCPSPSLRSCSNSSPLSGRCHETISSSVTRFSCLLSFPASGLIPMSWLFASGSQSIGASALASVLPMNIQS